MGSDIAHFFANSIPYCLFLYGLANFMWLAALKNDNEVGVVSIFTCLGYLILPFRVILNKFTRTKHKENVLYKDFRLKFSYDYDRQNPVTNKEAVDKFCEDLIKSGSNEEEQREILKAREQNKKKSVLDYIN